MNAMGYHIDNIELTSLTKAELAERLSERIGLSNREARDIVDGFFDIVSTELVQNGRVKLMGFGNFNVLEKKARPGRNLLTGETVEVKARRAIRFKTGPKLRQLMWQTAAPPTEEITKPTEERKHTNLVDLTYIK